MKLAKYLAHSGVASRRKSKELVLNGEILVNNEVIYEPSYLVKKEDIVTQGLNVFEELLLFVNKPRG